MQARKHHANATLKPTPTSTPTAFAPTTTCTPPPLRWGDKCLYKNQMGIHWRINKVRSFLHVFFLHVYILSYTRPSRYFRQGRRLRCLPVCFTIQQAPPRKGLPTGSKLFPFSQVEKLAVLSPLKVYQTEAQAEVFNTV